MTGEEYKGTNGNNKYSSSFESNDKQGEWDILTECAGGLCGSGPPPDYTPRTTAGLAVLVSLGPIG